MPVKSDGPGGTPFSDHKASGRIQRAQVCEVAIDARLIEPGALAIFAPAVAAKTVGGPRDLCQGGGRQKQASDQQDQQGGARQIPRFNPARASFRWSCDGAVHPWGSRRGFAVESHRLLAVYDELRWAAWAESWKD